MRVKIGDKKLVRAIGSKFSSFDLPKYFDKNSEHKFLAEQTVKNEINWSLSKYKHGNDIQQTAKIFSKLFTEIRF